jgi:integrase
MRLTQKWIEAFQPPAKRTEYWDTEIKGLKARFEPTGAKSFAWFRSVNSKSVNVFIGEFPECSVIEARTRATDYNKKRDEWRKDKYAGRSPFDAPREALTLQVAFDDYVENKLCGAKNPARAQRDAKLAFKRHVSSSLANRSLSGIVREDMRQLKKKVAKGSGPYEGNRIMQLLSATINFAIMETENFDGANPCRGLAKKKGTERERDVYVKREERPKFFAALAKQKTVNRDLHDAVWLAVTTGARRGDLFSARWEKLSLDSEPFTWDVPDPKNGEPYTVQLSNQAAEVFRSRRGLSDSPFVFPSNSVTGHLLDLKKSWEEFRTEAGFPGLRFHDLRRTFASAAAQSGVPLFVIAKMLGHAKSARVIETYARLAADDLRAGVTTATQALLAGVATEA